MMADWELIMRCSNERDLKRLHWLVKTLTRDSNVANVWVNESSHLMEGVLARIEITFHEGEDAPRGSTLQSLDHTHGRKTEQVKRKPPTWLERILGRSGV
jgi:hypothetical protein